jgi:ribosome modulation factor
MYKTLEEAFDSGYQVGLNWIHSWEPGGPWFYHANSFESKNRKDRVEFLQKCNKAWLNGWHKGRKDQIINMENY